MLYATLLAGVGRVMLDSDDTRGHMRGNHMRGNPMNHMYGDSSYGLMWIWPVLILALLGVVVYLIVRASNGGHSAAPVVAAGAPVAAIDPTLGARATLANRLAEGTIEVEDYKVRIAQLDGGA